MDSRYVSDSQYFNAAYAPTGLTPYLNGAMSEQNVFDSEYAAHSMEHNDFPAQAMSLPMYPLQTSSSSSDISFNPQLLGSSGRTSSSSSSSQSPGPVKLENASGSIRSRSKVPQHSTIPEVAEEGTAEHSNSVKRSKFLERNRLAAAKCRTKKKRWTNNLEAAARQASQQTRELHAIVQNLRDEVLQHKTQLMAHQGCDCHEIQDYLMREHSASMGAGEYNGTSTGSGQ